MWRQAAAQEAELTPQQESAAGGGY